LKSTSWLKCSLLLGLAFATAPAAPADDLIRARDLCYRQEYDSALAVVEAMSRCDTTDPAPYYWQASITQLLIYDSGNKQLIDSFYALSDRAIAKASDRIRCNPGDAQAHFYVGVTQLNRANLLAWQQRRLSAFKTLLGVMPQLRAALANDTALADARFGVGVIEYFKANADRYVFGLGLLGSRDKAYQLVKAVAERECLLQPAARFLYAYMLKEDGDYAGAVQSCQVLLQKYPGNRAALRTMRDAQYRGGMLSDALATGRFIEQEVLRACPGSRYALSENWIICGKAFAEAGQLDSARARFDRVIAWEPYAGEVPWLSNYVREAKRWLRKL
jgi:tetratricopeptide (TPR) repeat protein